MVAGQLTMSRAIASRAACGPGTSSPHGSPAWAPVSAALRLSAGSGTWMSAGSQGLRGGSYCKISRSARGAVQVRALESSAEEDAQQAPPPLRLKIGIVGFGTFGQFLARRMVQAGHEVIATSRSPYHDVAAEIGVGYFTDADDFCEEHPDVVLLASSILSLEMVLGKLPVQRLKRNTLFVDVLSVKVFPKTLLLRKLPPEMDILCTHPMFGPDSGKGTWSGLNLQYERVRIGDDPLRHQRCDAFLQFFEKEGCRMVEMTCEEHDQMAASTQFITHTVGRMLGAMELTPTPIDTKGFQSLQSLVDNTANDSFELYYGLFMYNQSATQELVKLEQAFDKVKRQLFSQLHDRLRDELGLVTQTSGSGSSSSSQPKPVAAAPDGIAETSSSADSSHILSQQELTAAVAAQAAHVGSASGSAGRPKARKRQVTIVHALKEDTNEGPS